MSKLEPTLTYSDLTATERLRAMLDERGVEWWEGDDERDTRWESQSLTWMYLESKNELCTGVGAVEMDVTPEQAIAATLGSGTCHDVGRYCFTCSECGHTMSEPHHMFNRNDPNVMPNFCPNCGAKVVDA